MPTSEIISMVKEALSAMAVGIPSVFIVLAVFYFVIKLMMAGSIRQSAAENEAKKKDADQS